MSNARSPREVCSTTMGTSGLIVLASFASSGGFLHGSNVPGAGRRARAPGRWGPRARPPPERDRGLGARRPDLAGALAGLLAAGGPELLARLGLLDGDRHSLAHEQLRGLAGGDVVAHALEAV